MIRAAPETWFETTRVGDDVTLIREVFVKPYYRCNIWHVRGRDRDMLVDSGMGLVSLRTYVPLVTEKPCLATATHTHYDHFGGHHEFPDRLVHHSEAVIAAHPTPENTVAAPHVSDAIYEALPPLPYSSTEYAIKAAPATVLLKDGDMISLGDRRFEVLHTPGHSPGSICLWEAETQILFSGDTLFDGPPTAEPLHADLTAWSRSLERLLCLPARVVHGGHFESHDDSTHRSLVRGWLDCLGAP